MLDRNEKRGHFKYPRFFYQLVYQGCTDETKLVMLLSSMT
jgi:hypothetical protein